MTIPERFIPTQPAGAGGSTLPPVVGTRATILAVVPLAGQVGYPTDFANLFLVCLVDGTWTERWRGIQITPAPLVTDVGWSWVNQGTATITQFGPFHSLWSMPSAALDIHCRVRSTPATPWTLRALIPVGGGGTRTMGLLLRESATGELYRFGVLGNPNGPGLAVQFDVNPTTAGAVLATNFNHPSTQFVEIEIEDDGVDLFFRQVMPSGQRLLVFTEGRTVRMAGGPDEFGYHVATTGHEGAIDIASWVVT